MNDRGVLTARAAEAIPAEPTPPSRRATRIVIWNTPALARPAKLLSATNSSISFDSRIGFMLGRKK